MPRGRKPTVLKPKISGATKEDNGISLTKMGITECRAYARKLMAENEELQKLVQYGHRCIICGELKIMTETTKHFYKNVDPMCRSTATAICRNCATKIARRAMADGVEKEPTKDSVRQALFYLNKPFLDKIWDDSMKEFTSEDGWLSKPEDMWKAYIRHVQNRVYDGMTFMDSDGLTTYKMEQEKNRALKAEEKISKRDQKALDKMDDDVRSTFLGNKKTIVRFLGYYPFENDPVEEQPILCSNLVSFFDDSVRDDGFKLFAVIEIVQNNKTIKVINDTIDKQKRELGVDPNLVISTIGKLTDTKKKLIDANLALAKDNGISVNHNKQSRKGAGTLSGILKEMSEMNLDDVEINTFDYETSQAMAQVEANSIKNILTQLNPDENDWQREVARQTDLLYKIQDERDKAVEYCRLLRKENKDLKDFLQEQGLIDETLNVIDINEQEVHLIEQT